MTTTDPWASFDAPDTGDYPEVFKWEPVGASIVGKVTMIRSTTFEGRVVPVMHILTEDGEERSVFCGPTSLLTQLLDKKPQVGQRVAIKFAKTVKTSGGYTAKVFDLAVEPSEDVTSDASAKTAADLL